MNYGVSFTGPYDFNLAKEQPFSYTNAINRGHSWKVDLPCFLPFVFADDDEWRLSVLVGDYLWVSPPLVIQGYVSNPFTRKTSLAGCDKTSYLLSKKATDKATYSKTTAKAIIEDLAGDVGVAVIAAPSYSVYEYDAHEGKIIDHISCLLQKGGYSFKIDSQGSMVCFPMDHYSDSGLGTGWIKDGNITYNPTLKKTSQQFIKGSKIQTAYEFAFTDAGFKTVSFSAPMQSVQVYDDSIVGFVDEVAFFDGSGGNSQQVGPVVLIYPDLHEGATFPVGTSAGPITSATLHVWPPLDEDGNYDAEATIDARVRFVCVPSEDMTGYDLSFEATETPGQLISSYTYQNYQCNYKLGLASLQKDYQVITAGNWSGYYYDGSFFSSLTDLENAILHTSITSHVSAGSAITVPFTEVDRPADTSDYIDCTIMPTEAHCNEVKKRIIYNQLKELCPIDFSGGDPLPMLEPGEVLAWPGLPEAVVSEVTISQGNTAVKCYPKIWW